MRFATLPAIFQIMLLTFVPASDSTASQWRMGMDIGWFGSAGNLRMDGAGVEFSINLRRNDEMGSWLVSLGRFEADVTRYEKIESPSFSSILIRRSARFRLVDRTIEIMTGAGIGGFPAESTDLDKLRGAPVYTAEIYSVVWSRAGREVSLGCAYRSGWIPGTDLTLDRLTILISMHRPLKMSP